MDVCLIFSDFERQLTSLFGFCTGILKDNTLARFVFGIFTIIDDNSTTSCRTWILRIVAVFVFVVTTYTNHDSSIVGDLALLKIVVD
jgi:hypothetical protein